jgi:predicted nucleotidyltransferase
MGIQIPIDEHQIADFCRRHHIRKLALFRSVLRDDFGPQSDVSMQVKFEPGHAPSQAFFDLETELSAIVGSRVDLSTPGFLSRYMHETVPDEAEVLYDAA